MPDFRKMTVQSLRELARKVLGPAGSRLKTKSELVDALEEAGAATPAKGSASRSKEAGGTAAAAGKAVRAARAAGTRAARGEGTAGKERGSGPARAVRAVAAGAAAGAKAAAKGKAKAGAMARAAAAVAGAAVGAAAGARAVRAGKGKGGASAPDPDGYFVARVRGEEAAREAPHPLVETDQAGEAYEEAGAPVHDEHLGELPWGYGDDAFVALPRDPRTVFLYWDWAKETLERAFGGLDHPRVQLWLFARSGDGWERIRALEFALESRGFYVHDLDPGRVYRAEIHVVDRQGQERLLAHGSNEVALPPLGPSPMVDDRFIRIPWEVPLGRLLGGGHAGGAFSEEARAMLARLSDWSRFAGKAVWGGSAGGMGGRPSGGPTSPVPTSPGGPLGPREK
ncbi:MAG TPA: DUF4912 domain-containing protein [Anaeromyxobacter sp.]|nr:DUF4912 domain-containing protein [Anaeromyxobacter sp.]